MEAMTIRRETSAVLGASTVVGGAVLVAQAIAAAFTDQNSNYAGSTGDFIADGLLALGLFLTLPGTLSLGVKLARQASWLAIAGQAMIVVSVVATIVAGHEVLDVVYVVGTVAWLAGTTGFAVAAARRGSATKVVVALPIACLLALALSDMGGALLLGVVWIIVGAGMGSVSDHGEKRARDV